MNSSGSRFSGCLYFSSNALARKIEKLAIESWKDIGIPPSHGYLLMMVLDEPGVQPGILSKELQLTPSTITRLIEKLEREKLVVRTSEGKLTNIYPTPKAKTLLPRMNACVQAFGKKYTSILGEQECTKLVRNMNQLNDQLKK